MHPHERCLTLDLVSMGYKEEKEEVFRAYWTFHGPAWDEFLRQRPATVRHMASEGLIRMGPRSDHPLGFTSAGERAASQFRAA